jgi:acylphosphatase
VVKEAHIFFKGSVQGVGFRWTARNLAQKYSVNGWVRNLSDGRVELKVQAEEERIYSYISALKEQMSGYIRDKDISWQKPQEKYKDFSIRYS